MHSHFMHLRKYELFPLPPSCSPHQVSITRLPCPLSFLHVCCLTDIQSHLNNKQMAGILNPTCITHAKLVWLRVCTCTMLDRSEYSVESCISGHHAKLICDLIIFWKTSLESSFEAVNCCFLKPGEQIITR